MKKIIFIINIIILIGLILVIILFKPREFSIINFNQQTNDSTVGILSWTESTNATKYEIIIYDKSGKVIKNMYTTNTNFEIHNLNINKGQIVSIDIIAYNNFKLKNNVKNKKIVNWQLDYKKKVGKIESTQSSGKIGINRAIRLFTKTEGSDIYYTTDGTNPTKDSIEYTGSIFIDKDMTIKAIAICDGMIDSDILKLQFSAVEKTPAIYLSPSVQDNNFGVSSVGYTTEMEMMNKVSDYIEKRLKKQGIIVYRNNPEMSLEQIVLDSSSYDVDMHIAIHSNQYNEITNGVETWVHDENSHRAIEIASIIQDSLMSIYYDKNANRGIKYSSLVGGMRETNPKKVTNGILVEIAFHDNYNDAKWIVNNQQLIGYTIADAIINYFN